jgi:hypothetical protein
MSTDQRYLVAKYTPDALRMEPRNIGIILWAAGRAHARFLTADDAYFIEDKKTYRRWINHWSSFLEEQKVSLPRKPAVKIDHPKFLDALIQTQKDNYLLFEGGFVIETVGRRGLAAATNQLYQQLVIRNAPEPASHKEQAARLKAECDKALSDSEISTRDDFRSSYRHPFRVRGVDWPLPFNYAIVNGHLAAAFQRVSVSAPQSINNAAFIYGQLLDNDALPKERCVALVRVDAAQTSHGPDPRESIGRLETVATVINLADAVAAREKLREIGAKAA